MTHPPLWLGRWWIHEGATTGMPISCAADCKCWSDQRVNAKIGGSGQMQDVQ